MPRIDGPLRVAINAQITPMAGAGGIEAVLIALIRSLGQLDDGPEEYTIIGPRHDPEWMKPYVGPNQRIVGGPSPAGPSGKLESFKRALSPLRPMAGKLWRWSSRWLAPPTTRSIVPKSDGFYESLSCDILHFPYQHYVGCSIPTVYNPHDLQHLHFPQYFTSSSIEWRETIYQAGCHFSNTIVVASQWVKDDIVHQYRIDPEKIQVIPLAPPMEVYPQPTRETVASIRKKYCLGSPFALYPAMTWEHKNHIRLLEALAMLRDRDGLKVNVVCTGRKEKFWPHIETRLVELGLQDQVKFVGMVPGEELRALYRLAQFVVVPTLFEAGSAPVGEASLEETPVACSSVTSLPEQVGDAALLFDPFCVEAIADAVAQMATDPNLREELRRRGARRLQDFSWDRTAKTYRAVYRRCAGHLLTEEDSWLLSWNWMREPQKTMEIKP